MSFSYGDEILGDEKIITVHRPESSVVLMWINILLVCVYIHVGTYYIYIYICRYADEGPDELNRAMGTRASGADFIKTRGHVTNRKKKNNNDNKTNRDRVHCSRLSAGAFISRLAPLVRGLLVQ